MKNLFRKHREVLLYLIFGALTTAVNYLVYFPLFNLLMLDAALSNAVAWVAAVAFAFVTNKPFVFQSHDWSAQVLLPELWKFVSCRLFSGVAESLILLVTVDICHWDGNLIKILTSILVVVLNYVGSKLLVFKK